jgi:hypothetical protein
MNSEIIQILACNNLDAFQHLSLILFQQTHFNIQTINWWQNDRFVIWIVKVFKS